MLTEQPLDPPADVDRDRDPAVRRRQLLVGGIVVLLLAAGLVYEIYATAPVRGAVQACSELFTAANEADLDPEQRIARARSLCTGRYLKAHKLDVAGDGQGLVGIPRNLDKNFQAWRHGDDVWICPTNRVGPVYQFVLEGGSWRFDGAVGLLRGRGEFLPMNVLPDSK